MTIGKCEMVKSQNCSSSSFFKQPSAIMRYMYRSKQPPIVMKFSGDVPFELCFERNWDLLVALSCREGQSVLAVGHHLSIHVRG